jgi:methionyl-tRNA formyltransferase
MLAGDTETGVCIMQMDAGLDSGPVLLSATQPIRRDDTAASLHDRLAEQGARLVVEALARLPLPAFPQAESGLSYAAKISKTEAMLDWCLPAVRLERQIRAFNPHPGAACCLDGHWLKVWRSEVVAGAADGRPQRDRRRLWRAGVTSDRGSEGGRQAPFGGAVPGRNGDAAGFPRQRLLRTLPRALG